MARGRSCGIEVLRYCGDVCLIADASCCATRIIPCRMQRPDSLIFDLDGTLWDTCPTCAVGWNNVVQRHGIGFREITADDVRRVAGKPHKDCIRDTFTDLPEGHVQVLVDETSEEDNRLIADAGGHIYEGVREGLARLAQVYPLYIVSGCQSGYIETFYSWSGLGGLFRDCECWGNTGQAKARNIEMIVRRNGLKAPVYIGDTEGDGVAARAAGLPFIYVEYGFGACTEADLRVSSFADLTEKLLALD